MASGSEVAAAAAANATRAVEAVASQSTNSMNPVAVEAASPQIAQAVQAAITNTPEVRNVLNTEAHWWQKRSRWSTIASACGGLVAAIAAVADYMSKNVDQNSELSYITFGFALWAGYSAYRAGTATVPLGQKPTQLPFPLNRG